jgi:hypothetical protein
MEDGIRSGVEGLLRNKTTVTKGVKAYSPYILVATRVQGNNVLFDKFVK